MLLPLGVAILLALGTAASASTSATSSRTDVAGAAHSSVAASLVPLTDGGCANDALGEAQLCFHFIGGGNTNTAVAEAVNLSTTGTLANVHILIKGPGVSDNSPTWSIGPRGHQTFTVCPKMCHWDSGVYEATLYQFYGGAYHAIVRLNETVGAVGRK